MQNILPEKTLLAAFQNQNVRNFPDVIRRNMDSK